MSKEQQELVVEVRTQFGDNASRRARKAGQIPAIVYSKGCENKAIYVNADQWKIVAARSVHMVTLVCGDEKIPALVREVQFNHLKNYVVHIDFQRVDLNAEITDKVPVVAVGECKAGTRGILEQEMHEVEVACRPADLPASISCDVSGLDLNDCVHVKDLVMPAGVKAVSNADAVVFHVVVTAAGESAASAEA